MPTKYPDRNIPKLSLRDFENRIDENTAQLVSAAETDGFFSVTDHGLAAAATAEQFALTQQFFALSDEQKKTVPWSKNNAGYEARAQIRPSTGAADQ
jgi:isopenicillin N synthase-like dioxygenase